MKTENFALVHSTHCFSTTYWQNWRITALAFPIRVSSSLFCLQSLENVNLRYLNFSVWWRITPFVWKEHWIGCRDKHIISVLTVLIFNPASKQRQKTDQVHIGDDFCLSLTIQGNLQTADAEHYTAQM